MDDPTAGFRRWAKVLFGVGLVLATWFSIATVGSVGGGIGLYLALTILDIVLLAAVLGVLVHGLGAPRRWAIDAAVVCCWLIILGGLINALAMSHGGIFIPVDSIAAILILNRRPATAVRPAASARDRRIAAVVLLGFVLAYGGPFVARTLDTTGALIADRSSLALDASLSCDGPTPGAAPEAVAFRASWTWSRRDLLLDTYDGVVLRWQAVTDDGAGFVYDGTTEFDPEQGFWLGDADPSSAMVQTIAGYGPSLAIGIDLATQQMRPGQVGVRLIHAGSSAHGVLTTMVSYIHRGRWEQTIDGGTCQW